MKPLGGNRTGPQAKKRGSLFLVPISLATLTGGQAFNCDVNHAIGLGQSCGTDLVCDPWSLIPFSLANTYDTHCFSMISGSNV